MNPPPEVVLALLVGAAVVLAYPVARAVAWAQHRLARDRNRKTAAVLAARAELAVSRWQGCNWCDPAGDGALTVDDCKCKKDLCVGPSRLWCQAAQPALQQEGQSA